ncbi:hypothetical protein NW752_003241 [Fusarium irregulare]|uniref:Uncharacterized protein n=1 Tax=Fusarium irregulare TaxID=2494466 RepID=A0A9W8Q175_9HYPO|nr:hypothetical protein NW766_000928 [Fusarium irregulare]KAJ4025765.1 hypothetical protein NW752_003241 [Fusarium irregulare]
MTGDTVISLGFLKDKPLYEREKPYVLFVGKPGIGKNETNTNVELETVRDIPLRDVRGISDSFTLDKHGFQFIAHQQTFCDFEDEDLVKQLYLEEVKEVIQFHVPYAKKVHIFDWRRRKQFSPSEAKERVSAAQLVSRSVILAPSQTVHSDTTEFSLLKRVKRELPDEANELMKGRIQMINFWRPIYHEVQNWPLVLCDAQTADLQDLRAVDQVTRRFIGDIYYSVYNDAMRWHYMSGMQPSEGALFKSWDTSPDGTAKGRLSKSFT